MMPYHSSSYSFFAIRFTVARTPLEPHFGYGTRYACAISTSDLSVSYSSNWYRVKTVARVMHISAIARLKVWSVEDIQEEGSSASVVGTHFMPRHCRVPLPNGTKYLSSSGFPIHLSGTNSLGSGKMSSFMRTWYVVMLTGVFREHT